jgi:hypothetical protein
MPNKERSRSAETKSSTANHEIPWVLHNPEVHYLIHNSMPLVPVLTHMNPVHAFLSSFFKTYVNIILPSIPSSPKQFFPSGLTTKPCMHFSYHSHVPDTLTISYSLHEHPKNIWWRIYSMESFIMQFPPVYYHYLHLKPIMFQHPILKYS